MAQTIKGMTTSLKWLSELLSFYQAEVIKIPKKYRERVIQTKALLESDTSGLVNTILDFSIDAALVDYRIESNNPNLAEILNKWLMDINSSLRGRIPTSVNNLAKEYFRERWKGSSHLVLRTFWEQKDDLILPNLLFFVDGEDIIVEQKDPEKVTLGDEKYYIRINNNPQDNIKLPQTKEELIFVQRPFESWGVLEPIPYIIRRGLFRNLRFMNIMSEKGEYVVARALEYLFAIKKGTENLTLKGEAELRYSDGDYQKVKEDFGNFLRAKKTEPGTPTHVTGFDTQMEHLIPDYQKAVNEAIYAPIEKKMLAGLGLVDIVTGTASTRREAILNPKPFLAEVNQGVKDFGSMLHDILQEIIEKNSAKHKKWMNAKIEIKTSPIQHFIDDKFRAMIRSAYDRGRVSGRTFVEIGLDLDYDLEVERRLEEKKKGHTKIMYPPVIQNMEAQMSETKDTNETKKEDVPEDKKSIEKKNFLQSLHVLEESECPYCHEIFDYESQNEIENGVVQCPTCGKIVTLTDIEKAIKPELFEQAPYTKKSYPPQLKNLPSGARSTWISTFNSVLKATHSETQARQAAWRNIKLKYKKVKDKWVKKSKGEVEEALKEVGLETLKDIEET